MGAIFIMRDVITHTARDELARPPRNMRIWQRLKDVVVHHGAKQNREAALLVEMEASHQQETLWITSAQN